MRPFLRQLMRALGTKNKKMELRYFLIGWTKEKAFWFICLILLTFLAIFASLNIGVGQEVQINGTVTSVGLNTTSRYELPAPIVTIQISSGQFVTIETHNNISISKGEKVILLQTQRLLTSGYDYKIHKVLP